jgi:hypothetical protein
VICRLSQKAQDNNLLLHAARHYAHSCFLGWFLGHREALQAAALQHALLPVNMALTAHQRTCLGMYCKLS